MQRSHSLRSMNETESERQFISGNPVAKPLPPLPRGWSRMCHETGLLLRTVGLGIVVTAFQGFFSKDFQEPEKIAIRRSRVTALLRTLIHAVPLGIAIFEIILNLKGRFIGRNFHVQNYLQFAAKAHEIAMQASIATILLSYIRFQISTGKGMPFGAVLGGLQFLQVSYLWSSELWSSILSKGFQLRKKICFVSLIFVCITIAATAGPSSANLIIARQGLWSTGPEYLAVKAALQDIWPDRLDGEKINTNCTVIAPDSIPNTYLCPLSDMYSSPEVSDRPSAVDDDLDIWIELDLQTPGASFSRTLIISPCFSFISRSCATIPQAGLLEGFYEDATYHYTRLDEFGEANVLESYQFLQKNYHQPYTTAICVVDVVKDGSDETPLRFPLISETYSDLKNDRIISIPSLTRGQIIHEVSGDISNFRVHWMDLPQNIFGTRIPGAVIVNPQGPDGPPYNVYQCTIDAGWGSSTIMAFGASAVVYSHGNGNGNVNFQTDFRQKIDEYGYVPRTMPDFANMSNRPFPERRISISKGWMEFLNPTIVLTDNSTTPFISGYLSAAKSQIDEGKVARALAVLLAFALSNTGGEVEWKVYNDSITAYTECNNCLVFEIENKVYGWLYTASQTTTKLAIAVMLAYCALVLGHVIYSIVSGVSSTAWDSTAEFVALTMNSSPTEILQNTCAGIIGSTALKTPVRVLATTQGHLELVFGEIKNPNAQASALVMNEKYGKLVSGNDNGGEEPQSGGSGELHKRAVCSELGVKQS